MEIINIMTLNRLLIVLENQGMQKQVLLEGLENQLRVKLFILKKKQNAEQRNFCSA